MVLAPKPLPLQIQAQLSYDGAAELYRLRFRALGTDCAVLFAIDNRDGATAFAQEASQWVANFEAKYSRFRDDSLISELNRRAGEGWVEIDEETESLFAICDDLHLMTSGALDPTMLPLIHLWDYRRLPASVPTDAEVAAAKSFVGWQRFERRPGAARLPIPGMALDLGGFGKEYAVDKVAALAVGHGIANILVDFGQDIHALGTPPGRVAWHVGLESPVDPSAAWGSLAARDVGVATSGDYRRFFESGGVRYGHIIDPRAGRPVANATLAVTVVAQSCLEAGVLSTAAFVLGESDGMNLIESTFGAEGCFVFENQLQKSSRFDDYLVQN